MSKWSRPETAQAVLTHLRELAGDNPDVTVSIPALAQALHIGQTTAYRGIQRLLDTGAIAIERLGSGGSYATRYRLTQTTQGPDLRPVA